MNKRNDFCPETDKAMYSIIDWRKYRKVSVPESPSNLIGMGQIDWNDGFMGTILNGEVTISYKGEHYGT